MFGKPFHAGIPQTPVTVAEAKLGRAARAIEPRSSLRFMYVLGDCDLRSSFVRDEIEKK